MALNNPAFESQDSTDAVAEQAAQDAGVRETKMEEAAASTVGVTGETAQQGALAPVQTSALAVAGSDLSPAELLKQANVLARLKDQLEVSWEDFDTINANQGQFLLKTADGEQIGTEIELQLISTQEQWLSAAGDMEAEGEGLVLYSDDGINASEGSQVFDEHVEYLRANGVEDRDTLTVKEHQAWLKGKGHDKAHVQHKVILVGELKKANDKAMDVIGNLVQVHLPDTGRRSFESHAKQSAFHIAQGRITKEDVGFVKLTAKMAGQGRKQFTQVKVGYADGHQPKTA